MGAIFDSLVGSRPVVEEKLPTAENLGEFSKGLGRGFHGLRGTLWDFAGTVTEPIAPDTARKLYSYSDAAQQDAAQYPGRVTSLKDIHNVSDLGDFAAGGAGQALPSLLASVGVGGPVGVGLRAAGAGLGAATVGGLAAGSYPAVTGELAGSMRRDPTIMSDYTPAQRTGMALAGGVPLAAIDALPTARAVGKVIGPNLVNKGVKNAVLNTLKSGFQTGVEEGVAEGTQQAGQIAMLGAMNPERKSFDLQETADAFALGFFGGGVPLGSAAGAAQAIKSNLPGAVNKASDYLKSRRPATTEQELTQRDMADVGEAEALAGRILEADAPGSVRRLTEEFMSMAKRTGEDAELYLREVGNRFAASDAYEKGRVAAKALREKLFPGRDRRLGMAMFGDIKYDDPPATQSFRPGVDAPYYNRYAPDEVSPRGFGVEPDVEPLLSYLRAKDFVSGVSKNLGGETKYWQDVADYLVNQAEWDSADNSLLSSMQEWIGSKFGAVLSKNETGEMIVPDEGLVKAVDGFSDKMKFTYEAMKLGGQSVPSQAAFDEVYNIVKSYESAEDMQMQQGKKETYDEESSDDIGTNEFEQNELQTEDVYIGKSEFADVPFESIGNKVKIKELQDNIRGSGGLARTIGVWDKAKRQAKDDADLRRREDELLKKYRKEPFTDREEALQDVNSKFVYLLDQRVNRPEGTVVRGEEFNNVSSKNNKWSVQAKNFPGPEHGTVWFKRKDGVEFATSVSKLIALGRKGGVTGESDGLAEQRDALLTGISSFLTAENADGSAALQGVYGFKEGADISWTDISKAANASSSDFSLRKGGGKSLATMVRGGAGYLPASLKLFDGTVADIEQARVRKTKYAVGSRDEKSAKKYIDYVTKKFETKDQNRKAYEEFIKESPTFKQELAAYGNEKDATAAVKRREKEAHGLIKTGALSQEQEALLNKLKAATSTSEAFKLAMQLNIEGSARRTVDYARSLGYEQEAATLEDLLGTENWGKVGAELDNLSELLAKAGFNKEENEGVSDLTKITEDKHPIRSLREDLSNPNKAMGERDASGEVARPAPTGELATGPKIQGVKAKREPLKGEGVPKANEARLAERKPAELKGEPLPTPEQSYSLLHKEDDTDSKIKQTLEKLGFTNVRPLIGTNYRKLKDVRTDKAVDAVFVYDSGGDDANYSIASRDKLIVGLRSDTITAENYTDAVKKLYAEPAKVAEPAKPLTIDVSSAPAFAKEKEAAKAKGADWVLAAESVPGSFASRIAAQAKTQGKLITDAKDVKAGDVVYLSVPGASREFQMKGSVYGMVPELLEQGAVVRMDTNQRAHTSHNKTGEGVIYDRLKALGYTVKETSLYSEWSKSEFVNEHRQPANTTQQKDYAIAGMQYVEGLTAARAEKYLTVGRDITFRREPNNPKDKNAVQVYAGQQRIGYVPKELAKTLAPRLDAGEPLSGVITGWENGYARFAMRDRLGNAMAADIHRDLGKKGFAATHDSPIRHEGKFDWRKHIGKGEGNAAFGAGTYLSTADGVHKNYKNQFTSELMEDSRFKGLIANTVMQALNTAKEIAPKATTDVWLASALRTLELNSEGTDANAILSRKGAEDLRKNQGVYRKALTTVSPTYHVTVNAKPEEIMDWDAPLSEQSELVKKAAEKAIWKLPYSENRADYVADMMRNWDGAAFYESIATNLGANGYADYTKASDYLQSLGIVGHKYAAAGGRNNKHPNYVIYDDSRIETNFVQFSGIQDNLGTPLTEAEQKEIKEHIEKLLGPKINTSFVEEVLGKLGGKAVNFSADWGPGVIRIMSRLTFGSAMDAANHESMHELFNLLRNEPAAKPLMDILLKAANAAPVVKQLERLLERHPAAMKQIHDKSPEFENERLAYMFQFWQAGKLVIGSETKSVFQKIRDWIRKVVGLLSEDQKAELIFRRFAEGQLGWGMAENPSEVAKILADDIQSRGTAIKKIGEWTRPAYNALSKLAFTAQGQLEDSNNPVLKKVSRMFNVPTGESGDQGMYEARAQMSSKFLNRFENDIAGASKADLALALEYLQKEDGSIPRAEEARKVFLAVRKLLDDLHPYITQSGIERFNAETNKWETIPYRKNYFPVVYDMEKIAEDPSAFVKDLVDNHSDYIQERLKELKFDRWNDPARYEEYARAIVNRLLNSNGAPDLNETTWSLGFSPLMTAINKRSLDWIKPEIRSKYQNKDLVGTMTSYIMQSVKRAEYVRRFGNGGDKLRDLIVDAKNAEVARMTRERSGGKAIHKVSKEEWKEMEDKAAEIIKKYHPAIMALEGTLGYDINPTLRELSASMMVYQNFRILVTSLFSSLIDPLGIMVRGGTAKNAYDTFIRGVKEVGLRWKGEKSKDEATKLAEMMGTVDAGTFLEALGQTYSSLYMYGKVKRWNDWLFKINGMEAWTRATRVGATQAAIEFIQKHMATPTDNSKRWLDELFGENQRPVLVDGKLDTTDKKVQMAVMKWVDGAILRPNAAQRPSWASDPHWALVWHMKQFTYTFHKVILERVWNEAYKHGNIEPMMLLMATYIPMMIAADAAKALLITGDEPYWMKEGLSGQISHGAVRANLMGIPQLPLEAYNKDVAQIAGPSAEWVKDWVTEPAGEQALGSLPFGSVVRQWG